MKNIAADIVEDVVEDAANNTNDLTMHGDINETGPDFRCGEAMEDVSVAESVDEFTLRVNSLAS